MNCWMLVSISSKVSIPYLVMRFIGVPVELKIMMIFAPCFHPYWLFGSLCQILIEQVDWFGLSVEEFWELYYDAIKQIDTRGGGIVDRDCRIGLSGNEVKRNGYWDILWRIGCSYYFWNRSSSNFNGSCAGGCRGRDGPGWLGHLDCGCLGKLESFVFINKVKFAKIISVGTSCSNYLVIFSLFSAEEACRIASVLPGDALAIG